MSSALPQDANDAYRQTVADETNLPPAPSRVGTVRRDPNGKIEAIDPTSEKGAGPQLCDIGTICVGTGQAYPSLSAALAVARDGDVIEIAGGTYRKSVKITPKNVVVRGIGGLPHFDCAGLKLADDKACLLLAADGVTIDNLEISGAELPNSLGANGACIRNEPNLSFTLHRIVCHGSQDGILTSGGSVVIEDSEFYDNGWTGQTHNVYFSGDCPSVTVRRSIFRDAKLGHEFKSRCRETTVSNSTIRSTKGSRNLDISDGGKTVVYRTTLVKIPGTVNHDIVGFAPETCRYPEDMLLKDVRIVNSEPNAIIRNYDKCTGHAIILEHVEVEGTAPLERGYILKR